jgi:GNAT superfamily N-acetyltransferase
MEISEYSENYKDEIFELIIGIQQNEFNLPVTRADQPDLSNIPGIYLQGKGNFWVALDGDKVGGTIALIDIGGEQGVIRKMFVAAEYRGKEKATAQKLLDTLLEWCKSNNINRVYLGTIDIMKAAGRFYEKNGFEKIEKTRLPARFSFMPVDNVFYKLSIR